MKSKAEDADFALWGFEGCPHCASLDGYLQEKGVPYRKVDVPDPEERKRLYAQWAAEEPSLPAPTSMPQLRMERVCLGGNQEVRAKPVEWLLALAGKRVEVVQ